MSKVCPITGRRPSVGNNVSHSNRKTKRRFMLNLVSKKLFNPFTGRMEKMRVSAKGLRILRKKMR
jgi:large subunit ribosomal protein L28